MITATELDHCVLCPRLCGHSCPVTVATGREAATPTAIATIVLRWLRGEVTGDLAARAATLCTDCGACEQVCGIERPVVAQLQSARAALLPNAQPAPLQESVGGATMVAIECDGRPWSGALATHLQRGVAHLRTSDHLGGAALCQGDLPEDHASALRDRLAGRTAVVACHSCARVVEAAGIDSVHLSTLVTLPEGGWVHHPCCGPQLTGKPSATALACCGAGGPLSSHHPELAQDLGRAVAEQIGDRLAITPDVRCATHLRAAGASVMDPVDVLLGDATP